MCVTQHDPNYNATEGLSAKYSHLIKKYDASQYKYNLPDDIDWRTSGAVTSIKDQVCDYSAEFSQ